MRGRAPLTLMQRTTATVLAAGMALTVTSGMIPVPHRLVKTTETVTAHPVSLATRACATVDGPALRVPPKRVHCMARATMEGTVWMHRVYNKPAVTVRVHGVEPTAPRVVSPPTPSQAIARVLQGRTVCGVRKAHCLIWQTTATTSACTGTWILTLSCNTIATVIQAGREHDATSGWIHVAV